MLESMNLAILVGAALIAASAFTSLLAQRIGSPLLLLFLGIGLLAGEDGLLGIEFDNAPAAYFVGSLALAIILFDSGFETSFQAFRLAGVPGLLLATVGVVLTAGVVGPAAHFLFDLGWLEGMVLGVIVASTDAAAVFFLLRAGGINLRDRVKTTLEIESGTNDPMAIFLTITLVGLATAAGADAEPGWDLARQFLKEIGLGLVLGIAGGLAIAWVLNRLHDLEAGLYPIVALSLALIVFAATGMLGGSGFLAAYVAGVVARNSGIRHVIRLRRFQVGMTWLAQIGMFLTLGLLATPSEFGTVIVPGLALAFVLIFIARPVAVWPCLWPLGFSQREMLFTGWVGLRGAVSILLAILPTVGGMPNGDLYFNVVFVMVLVSMGLQGWTIGFAARRLRVGAPPREGPVHRIELELPGSADQELVGYRIHPDSAVAKGERVPRWARPVLVVRANRSYSIHEAGPLRAKDHVYLFATPRQIDLLDKIYAAPVREDVSDFYGDLGLVGGVKLAELAAMYGAELGSLDPETTAGDLFEREFNGNPEVGDRRLLGPVELVVRRLNDDGSVAEVGLVLDHSLRRAGSSRSSTRWLPDGIGLLGKFFRRKP